MAKPGSSDPERFCLAATYAGFGGSPGVASKFSNDTASQLYGLYQQATEGPCNISKPTDCSPIEQSKWTSWKALGNMDSTEAKRLFVKILEEEDPGWYSRVSDFIAELVQAVELNDDMEEGFPEEEVSVESPLMEIPEAAILNILKRLGEEEVGRAQSVCYEFQTLLEPSMAHIRPIRNLESVKEFHLNKMENLRISAAKISECMIAGETVAQADIRLKSDEDFRYHCLLFGQCCGVKQADLQKKWTKEMVQARVKGQFPH